MARRRQASHGGHGWFVTFADLMGLLVSFFVMLVAFSNQDARKVVKVAGSMREAFGSQPEPRFSGIVESDGLTTRLHLKHAAHIEPQQSSTTPTPAEEQYGQFKRDNGFALAAASLRQALEALPELTEVSKHIILNETAAGLNIELVDQDGRSMFPEGSKDPYEVTSAIIQKLAGPLKAAAYRVSIVGHTATKGSPTFSAEGWQLSAARANAVRQILEEQGYPAANFYKIAGRANTDPLFPENPSAAPNRRVTITLVREAPALPPDLRP